MDLNNSIRNKEDASSRKMARSVAYTPDGQEVLIEGDPSINMEFSGGKPTKRFKGNDKEWEVMKGEVAKGRRKRGGNRGNI